MILKNLLVVRPINLLLIVLTQVLVINFGIYNDLKWFYQPNPIYVIFITVLVAAAGNIINDYYDWNNDGWAQKRRWKLNKTYLLYAYKFLGLITLFSLIIVANRVQYMVVFNVVALFNYSYYFKGKPLLGNILIAVLSASVVLIIGMEYNDYSPFIITFSLFSFISTLFREVVKDIEDIDADTKSGLSTLPIAIGVRSSKVVLFLIAMAWFVLPWIQVLYYLSNAALITAIANTITVSVIVFLLLKSSNQKDMHRISAFSKIAMLVGILSIVFY